VRSSSVRQSDITLILIVTGLILLGVAAPHAVSQSASDATTLSYRAFNQLSNVYRAGGHAPDLVAKLNDALGMIQEAQIKRAHGDMPSANRLEDQAKSTIQSVLSAIPAAQDQAISASNMKTLTILASIPIIVAVSTFAFYAALRVWRYYEKLKLYEMKIVEKKAEA
jgi:hypothetical protein